MPQPMITLSLVLNVGAGCLLLPTFTDAAPQPGAIPWTGSGSNTLWSNPANWTGNNLPDQSLEFGYFGIDNATFSLAANVQTSAGIQVEAQGVVGDLGGHTLEFGRFNFNSAPAGQLLLDSGSLTLSNGTLKTAKSVSVEGDLILQNAYVDTDAGGIDNDGSVTLHDATFQVRRNPAINGTMNFFGDSKFLAHNIEFGSGDPDENPGPYNAGVFNFELNGTNYNAGDAAIQTSSFVNLVENGQPTSQWGTGEAFINFSLADSFTPNVGQVFHIIHADALPSPNITPGEIKGEFLNLADDQLIEVGNFRMQADYGETLFEPVIGGDPYLIRNLLTLTVIEELADLLLGDLNLDGSITGLDIQPFVNALADPTTYKATNNLSDADFLAVADINQDGQLTGLDIQPFVDLLSGSTGVTALELQAVPEPGTAALLLAAAGFMIRRRR